MELEVEERKDQGKIKLKDDWFEREKGEYVSGNVEMTDDCAHTCQLFPETKVRESQEGSVARGSRCEAMPRDQGKPKRDETGVGQVRREVKTGGYLARPGGGVRRYGEGNDRDSGGCRGLPRG